MSFNSLSEKSAYLLGLIKGKGVDDEIVTLTAELLNDISHAVDSMGRDIDDLSDRTDELDDEVGAIAEDVYSSDCCGKCGGEDGDMSDDELDDADDESMYEVICPTCGEEIYLDEDMLSEGSLNCPACGEPLELDVSLDDEEQEETF
ncbi:MAG: hypothetical protein J6I96_05680 [Oscillospiraceae bacterium]|nr:hypothetical protein [Oscillospiraceae bacterium]